MNQRFNTMPKGTIATAGALLTVVQMACHDEIQNTRSPITSRVWDLTDQALSIESEISPEVGGDLTLESTTLFFPKGSAESAFRVRMSAMNHPPEMEGVRPSEIGTTSSEITRIQLFDPTTNETLPSSFLKQPFEITKSFSLSGSQDNIGMVVLSDPLQPSSSPVLLQNDQLSIKSLGLTGGESSGTATVKLKLSDGVLWLVKYNADSNQKISTSPADGIGSNGGSSVEDSTSGSTSGSTGGTTTTGSTSGTSTGGSGSSTSGATQENAIPKVAFWYMETHDNPNLAYSIMTKSSLVGGTWSQPTEFGRKTRSGEWPYTPSIARSSNGQMVFAQRYGCCSTGNSLTHGEWGVRFGVIGESTTEVLPLRSGIFVNNPTVEWNGTNFTVGLFSDDTFAQSGLQIGSEQYHWSSLVGNTGNWSTSATLFTRPSSGVLYGTVGEVVSGHLRNAPFLQANGKWGMITMEDLSFGFINESNVSTSNLKSTPESACLQGAGENFTNASAVGGLFVQKHKNDFVTFVYACVDTSFEYKSRIITAIYNGSSWSFEKIKDYDLNVVDYMPGRLMAASNADGTISVAMEIWSNSAGMGDERNLGIHLSTRQAGGGWSAPSFVPMSARSGLVSLYVDSNNRVTVIVRQAERGGLRFSEIQQLDGGKWGKNEIFTTKIAGSAMDPQVIYFE